MYNEFYVNINTIDRVKEFVKIVETKKYDIDIICGRYIIDAKSIMGIFSLDLSKHLLIKLHTFDINECNDIKNKLKTFMVE